MYLVLQMVLPGTTEKKTTKQCTDEIQARSGSAILGFAHGFGDEFVDDLQTSPNTYLKLHYQAFVYFCLCTNVYVHCIFFRTIIALGVI